MSVELHGQPTVVIGELGHFENDAVFDTVGSVFFHACFLVEVCFTRTGKACLKIYIEIVVAVWRCSLSLGFTLWG